MYWLCWIVIILILPIFTVEECGEFTPTNNILETRIVNGELAVLGEFPWQVSLQRRIRIRLENTNVSDIDADEDNDIINNDELLFEMDEDNSLWKELLRENNITEDMLLWPTEQSSEPSVNVSLQTLPTILPIHDSHHVIPTIPEIFNSHPTQYPPLPTFPPDDAFPPVNIKHKKPKPPKSKPPIITSTTTTTTTQKPKFSPLPTFPPRPKISLLPSSSSRPHNFPTSTTTTTTTTTPKPKILPSSSSKPQTTSTSTTETPISSLPTSTPSESLTPSSSQTQSESKTTPAPKFTESTAKSPIPTFLPTLPPVPTIPKHWTKWTQYPWSKPTIPSVLPTIAKWPTWSTPKIPPILLPFPTSATRPPIKLPEPLPPLPFPNPKLPKPQNDTEKQFPPIHVPSPLPPLPAPNPKLPKPQNETSKPFPPIHVPSPLPPLPSPNPKLPTPIPNPDRPIQAPSPLPPLPAPSPKPPAPLPNPDREIQPPSPLPPLPAPSPKPPAPLPKPERPVQPPKPLPPKPTSSPRPPFPPRPPVPNPESRRWKWQHFCGGSIIDNYWIMTAAHCVESLKNVYSPGMIQIVAGSTNWRQPDNEYAQMISVDRIIVHEGWTQRTGQNDIALLHLATPINYVKKDKIYVNNICLSHDTQHEYVGVASSSGWGFTSKENRITPEILRRVDLPIVDHITCKNAFSRVIGISTKQVCAGRSPKGNCMGDSGGPLIIKSRNKATQIGIVSFSIPCAVPGYPDVFTRVSSYIDWIYAKTGINFY